MLLHPAYFGSIFQYVCIANAKTLIFEINDNYQKQTYRNRCYIYGPNGKHLLSVPVVHLKGTGKQKTKDMLVDNSVNWQKLHNRALLTGYSSSPFFEYYIDDLSIIFKKRYKFLLDLNLDTMISIFDCLELEKKYQSTHKYDIASSMNDDYRYSINAKGILEYNFQKYTQVFAEKYGFISNLSILDLLFNEGPNTLDYLMGHNKIIT